MMSDGLGGSQITPDHEAEAAALHRRLAWLAVGLLLVITAAIVAMVLLGDVARTDDIRRLALLAVLAGLVGGATLGLLALTELGDGVQLRDGTSLLRGRAAAGHASDLRDWEQSRRDAEAQGYRPPPRPEPSGGFSVSEVPEVLVMPLLGAVLGFIAFAGVVGGFLVASTSPGTTYSPAAIMFIAFLAGMFATKFLNRLSAAADALFGEPVRADQRRPQPQPRTDSPPEQDERT